MKVKLFPAAFLALLVFLLSSCLGANIDIRLNQNGSGTISLEYFVSRSLDSLGKLDGNERWNTIPTGRADFQRSIDRLPEMRLLSFSSKEDDRNIINTARMEFSSVQGLLAFLDSGGRRCSFSTDAGFSRLVLTLSEGRRSESSSLDELIAGISASYAVKISVSFPGEGSLAVMDRQGRPLSPDGPLNARGRTVSCSFPLYEILSSEDGIDLVFSWQP
jgi:hypothetical protein